VINQEEKVMACPKINLFLDLFSNTFINCIGYIISKMTYCKIIVNDELGEIWRESVISSEAVSQCMFDRGNQ
jgi:hypothetical protein